MRLTLMRHGMAAMHGPWSDADRPLTPEGEGQAHESAQGLRCLDLDITHIHSSPATRCRHTAGIVAETLGRRAQDVDVVDDLSLSTSIDRLLDRLRSYDRKASVLWVGHQPVLERFASVVLLQDAALPFQLLPAACVGLHCSVRQDDIMASLLWLMRSHELGMLRPADDVS